MQVLESIRDFSMHIDFSGLHSGHRWLMHFECASEFSRLCHTCFGWGFISRHGAYQRSSSPRKRPSRFGHFIFMYGSSTFLSHIDNTSFLSHMDNTSFFFPISFGEFWRKSYANMWGHYGSKIVGIFLSLLSEVLDSTTDIF